MIVFIAGAFVDDRELAPTDLFSDVVSILHGVPLIKAQQVDPFDQKLLVLEEELLILIDAVAVTDLYPKTVLYLKDPPYS